MNDRDLALSPSHDLAIVDFDLQLTDDRQTLPQRIKQALLTFKGEWFLNDQLGMLYYEEILGQKSSMAAIRAIFLAAIRKVDGVREVIKFAIELKEDNLKDDDRNLKVSFAVIDNANKLLEIEL